MTKSGHVREDLIGRLGPHERPWAFVGDGDVVGDRGFELSRAAMDPAAQELPAEVERKVRSVPGVTDANVEIVFDPP